MDLSNNSRTLLPSSATSMRPEKIDLASSRSLLCPLKKSRKNYKSNRKKDLTMIHCFSSTNMVGDWARKLLLLLHCSRLEPHGKEKGYQSKPVGKIQTWSRATAGSKKNRCRNLTLRMTCVPTRRLPPAACREATRCGPTAKPPSAAGGRGEAARRNPREPASHNAVGSTRRRPQADHDGAEAAAMEPSKEHTRRSRRPPASGRSSPSPPNSNRSPLELETTIENYEVRG